MLRGVRSATNQFSARLASAGYPNVDGGKVFAEAQYASADAFTRTLAGPSPAHVSSVGAGGTAELKTLFAGLSRRSPPEVRSTFRSDGGCRESRSTLALTRLETLRGAMTGALDAPRAVSSLVEQWRQVPSSFGRLYGLPISGIFDRLSRVDDATGRKSLDHATVELEHFLASGLGVPAPLMTGLHHLAAGSQLPQVLDRFDHAVLNTPVAPLYTEWKAALVGLRAAAATGHTAPLRAAITADQQAQQLITQGNPAVGAGGERPAPALKRRQGLLDVRLSNVAGSPTTGGSIQIFRGKKIVADTNGADCCVGANGQAFFTLPGGDYLVEAGYGLNGTAAVGVYVTPGLVTATSLTLDTGVLDVQLLNAAGSPSAGGTVQVRTGTRVVADTSGAQCCVDRNGHLSLVLAAGHYTVTAGFGDNGSATRKVAVDAGVTTSTALTLHTGVLEVQLRNAEVSPATGGSVQVLSGTRVVADSSGPQCCVNASGQASFVLSAGHYTVKARYGANGGTTEQVDVRAGATTSTALSFDTGVLEVHLLDAAGSPVSGGDVRVLRGIDVVAHTRCCEDRNGRASLILAAGRYTVEGEAGSGRPGRAPVLVTEGTTTAATIRGVRGPAASVPGGKGTLTVQLQNTRGVPAPGGTVTVLRHGSAIIDSGHSCCFLDVAGRASFVLAAGRYSVTGAYGVNGSVSAPVVVRAGKTTRTTLTVGTGVLHVQLLRAAGVPAPAGTVTVLSGVDAIIDSGRNCCILDAAGRGSFILAAGRYTIRGDYGVNGTVSAPVVVTAGKTTSTTLTVGTGVLYVQLFNTRGAPAPGGTVTVLSRGSPIVDSGRNCCYLNAAGRTSFILAAGRYEIRGDYGVNGGAKVSVVVRPGGTSSTALTVGTGVLQVQLLNARGVPAPTGTVTILGHGKPVVDTSNSCCYPTITGQATFVLTSGTYEVSAAVGGRKRSTRVVVSPGETVSQVFRV
jgi:hypothetical protein